MTEKEVAAQIRRERYCNAFQRDPFEVVEEYNEYFADLLDREGMTVRLYRVQTHHPEAVPASIGQVRVHHGDPYWTLVVRRKPGTSDEQA